ncbi:uncharacterized protein LOC113321716 isoform X2 [Papaver somniferum]|uniref:uncharacterized protein LOC113321716 isoform X2 n=1 Tax=Papaver somniferum TaxID=3469 RepID=UPI000E6FF617|nr:uncharacterized protein LOC113321716 isoform X2 [Papaver somniferum]
MNFFILLQGLLTFGSQGVQQGDPLGPLLFGLALHQIAEKIASHCTLDLHAWYLDDGTIACDTMEVSKVLKIIQSDGPSRGLHLNVTKTKIFWPSFDPRREAAGVFPPNIGMPSVGVELLGGPVSLGLQYCIIMVHSRVGKPLQLMDKMKQLQDLQSELLLLRNCSGVSRLYFTLRITTPSAIQTDAAHFDKHLFQYLRQIVVRDGVGFGLIQQRLVTLPLKDGGLGIHTMSNTCQFCFLAPCAQTQHLQTTILKQLSVQYRVLGISKPYRPALKSVGYQTPSSASTTPPLGI